MRARMLLLVGLVATALALPSAAQAATSTVGITAKITHFTVRGKTLTATGIMTGTLGSNGQVTRDTSAIRFRVLQRRRGARCDILTLHLQQLDLQLLGARVDTSAINLELYARRGAILGNLFCALSRARIQLPRVVKALNRKLHGRPLNVMAARSTVPAAQTTQPTCQVLNLILGPLHLDLLGLNVDLYGQTKSSPVRVTIAALPGQGLLGDVLCSLAGGAKITSLASLQSLLQSLGVTKTETELQDLLNQLGITDLATGLTNADLQRILQALGVTGAGT